MREIIVESFFDYLRALISRRYAFACFAYLLTVLPPEGTGIECRRSTSNLFLTHRAVRIFFFLRRKNIALVNGRRCLRALSHARPCAHPSFLSLSLSLSLSPSSWAFFIFAAIARSQACRILTHENGPKGCASHDRCSIRSESTETARQIIYS